MRARCTWVQPLGNKSADSLRREPHAGQPEGPVRWFLEPPRRYDVCPRNLDRLVTYNLTALLAELVVLNAPEGPDHPERSGPTSEIPGLANTLSNADHVTLAKSRRTVSGAQT